MLFSDLDGADRMSGNAGFIGDRTDEVFDTHALLLADRDEQADHRVAAPLGWAGAVAFSIRLSRVTAILSPIAGSGGHVDSVIIGSALLAMRGFCGDLGGGRGDIERVVL